MSMTNELVKMATISNIMLLREKLGYSRQSFDELNSRSYEDLAYTRDELIKLYNDTVGKARAIKGQKPDGCIIEPDGTIKSDCIVKEDDE
jgi:hypothetical protein